MFGNSLYKKYNLPDSPGVYFFKQGKQILYIGKATSLKDRVRSYFASDLGETPYFAKATQGNRGPKIARMMKLADSIDWQETDSVLEALLLESELIKKHQPLYNTREKDDKSYWYVIITNEDFPRILPIRGRELQKTSPYAKATEGQAYLSKSSFARVGKVGIKEQFGPFPYGAEMKEALKIIRKIFPYRDTCLSYEERIKRLKPSPRGSVATLRGCFNRQIGLCPGVCTGEISKTDYCKIVRNIKLFFEGKKKEIIKNLEREMKSLSKKQEFEKASKIRDQIFALNHIRDVSLLKNKTESSPSIRIEAYDIAHLSGKNTTGSMVVWQDGEIQKNEYRKFKLKGVKANQPDDPANLREILERRFNHPEWGMPDIIVVDGNQVQVEVIKKVIKVAFLTPQIVAVTKDDKHKASKLVGDSAIVRDYHRPIIEANAEAHRFALAYHRKLRRRLL